MSRVLLAVLVVVTALVVQVAALSALPAPGGGRPDLVLVVVVAVALAQGPLGGAVTGFAGGLLGDLVGDHPVGLLALTLCLVGYLAGLLRGAGDRSILAPLGVVASAAVGATLVYAGLGLATGSPRVGVEALSAGLPTSVLYDVLLAPFVVPVVLAVARRLDPGGQERGYERGLERGLERGRGEVR